MGWREREREREICVLHCVQLSKIKLYLFSTSDNELYQTVEKYVTRFQTVPICDNLCKMSETYLFGHSLAQFYTVKHTYARLSTKIISTRVRIRKLCRYFTSPYQVLYTCLTLSVSTAERNKVVCHRTDEEGRISPRG